jgi:lipopolysaccharide transport system ATP-binding protein
MSDIAVRVENLGKEYRIGGPQERYRTLRDSLTDALVAPFRKAGKLLRGQSYGAAGLDESIWALKDVSFEVKHGEVVGIIGRNGAGKSTLLKILSRITEPTEGYADIYGRVGALLEVGTGFHPELTGRENIYLNGAILGMTRAEIDRKFDEIVAFAEVERFIDTPVKHYSSGMGLRLGFAVAAHLEPEILVVDEVLAVGDASFQRKCLGKMASVAHQGRTVLFVSHNMAAIQNLCSKAILLEMGSLSVEDTAENVISAYIQNNNPETSTLSLAERKDRLGNRHLRFTKVQFCNSKQEEVPVGQTGQHLTVILEYEKETDHRQVAVVGMVFSNMYGQSLFGCISRYSENERMIVGKNGQFACHIPNLPLLPGRYDVRIWCKVEEKKADDISSAFSLDVIGGDFFGTGKLQPHDVGDLVIPHSWECTQEKP